MKPVSRYSLAEHKVDSVLEMLRGRSQGILLPENDSLLKDVLEDLASAMEELRAAHAEVDAQRQGLDRAFQEVEREHQRYAELFENAPDGYVVTDRHGVIEQANRAALELIESPRDFIAGKPLALFVNKEDKKSFFLQLNGIDALEAVRDWELRFQPWKGESFWASINIAKVQTPEHEDISLRWLIRDITQRKQTENLVKVRLTLLEFAASHSVEELLQKTLDEICRIIDSPIGFFHFVESDQKTLSLQAWSTRTVEEFCNAEGKGAHYPIEKAGVWVDCVREKRPVIHNDYPALSHRKGLPDGHPPVTKELVVPIVRSGRVAAILGIGNKPEDYTQEDVEVASYLADVAWEITRRKLAEEELKKTYQKLDLTLESLTDGFLSLDREWRFTFFNKAGAGLLGMKQEDLIGGVLWELFPEAVNLEFYSRYRFAVETNTPVHFEEYYPSPLNKWWECHAYPSSEGLSVFFRDVTERKLIEDAQVFLAHGGWMASGEDFFESLARYLGQSLGMDFVCIDRLEEDSLSARTLAVYFDDKFEDNLTYTLKDTPCGEVVEKKICCFPKGVRHLFPGDLVLQEMKAESYVGTTLWGFKGQPIGLIAVIGRQPLANPRLAESMLQLVAVRAAGELERKRAEEALRHSEQQYRLLFETMHQGVIFKDSAGKVISMNSAAERILGRSMAEYVGHASVTEEHPAIREDGAPFPGLEHPSMVALRTGIENKNTVMGVYNPIEQAYRWLSINSVPLFQAGEPSPHQVYTTFEDITARKQMEEELKKSHDELELRVQERTSELQKAGERLRSLASDLLVAGENERKLIAQEIHDSLSSQLAAIKYHLEIRLSTDRDPARSGENIRQVSTLVQTAIEDTRRIMANLRPSILDDLGILPTINWLCREFQKMNPAISPFVDLEICEEDIPDNIKTVIFRLLQEALNNLHKYSRADRVEISLKKIGSIIAFRVSDNGQGFSAKKVLSRKKIGHGFGLRGMSERVELSGGKFRVKSAPGKGTLIWVEWDLMK